MSCVERSICWTMCQWGAITRRLRRLQFFLTFLCFLIIFCWKNQQKFYNDVKPKNIYFKENPLKSSELNSSPKIDHLCRSSVAAATKKNFTRETPLYSFYSIFHVHFPSVFNQDTPHAGCGFFLVPRHKRCFNFPAPTEQGRDHSWTWKTGNVVVGMLLNLSFKMCCKQKRVWRRKILKLLEQFEKILFLFRGVVLFFYLLFFIVFFSLAFVGRWVFFVLFSFFSFL